MPDLDIEGKLTLSFPRGWKAIKFDDQAWYRDDIKSQVKAVDVVAVRGTTCWWIEVKDCAGYEAENMPRLTQADPPAVSKTREWIKKQALDKQVQVRRYKPFIVDELFEKFMGTMVCTAVAQRSCISSKNAADIKPYMVAMSDKVALNFVLLLTWGGADFKRLAKLLKSKMDQRMSAMNVSCFVVGENEQASGQPWRVCR